MSNEVLPTVAEAYISLCKQGDQFTNTPLAATPLGALTYEHPEDGTRLVAADDRVLAATGRLYVANEGLNQALRSRNANVAPMGEAARLIEQHLTGDRMVWGTVGYASGGFDLTIEGEGMQRLYEYAVADDRRRPSLLVDGGSSVGVLGLNGVLAKKYGIPTLGFTPVQGIAKMAPRDHVVVWGDLYPARQILVGSTPDIVFCWGGGPGAQMECIYALKKRSVVVLMSLGDYGSEALLHTYQSVRVMRRAAKKGRLIICETVDDIPARVDAAMKMCARKSLARRPARIRTVRKLLLSA